ncbi:hypothetical protein EDF75_2704 [Raoultella sp. BIGb0149]|nr:hypothetical protein EDF75_2704 [Raoultella sp. BIGb0149]
MRIIVIFNNHVGSEIPASPNVHTRLILGGKPQETLTDILRDQRAEKITNEMVFKTGCFDITRSYSDLDMTCFLQRKKHDSRATLLGLLLWIELPVLDEFPLTVVIGKTP